jgi:hypothetical protein
MLRLFRRPTVLRVTARSVDTPTTRAVNLYPGDTFVLQNACTASFKIVFTKDGGLELIQLAPVIAADPAVLRRWAAFAEDNR